VARNTTRRRGFEKAKRGRQTATAEQSERNADAVGNSTRGVAVGRFQNETRNVRGGEGIEGFGKRYVPAFPKSRRLFAHTILTLFWQNSKEKLTQDVLIDNLQQTLKQLQSRDSVFQAQAGAQKKETELARQTLSAANDEMAVVQLEKQQLVSQWKSALVGNAKRDEALKVTREALTKQRQDMLLLDAETNGKSASMKEQSRKNEQLVALLRKTEAEANAAQKQLEKVLLRKEKLAETYERLVVAQVEADAALARAKTEETALEDGLRLVETDTAATKQEIQTLDEKTLARCVCKAFPITTHRLPVCPYKTDTFFYWYQPRRARDHGEGCQKGRRERERNATRNNSRRKGDDQPAERNRQNADRSLKASRVGGSVNGSETGA
jgi:hypothetical protein|tara:strand:- start:1022 stop:2167 length:1146 start_codon:yes stop_codon:yes gene_type:complete